MRRTIHKQLPLVEPAISHRHAEELEAIDGLIKECPQIASLIYKDLIQGLLDPEAGRKGLMTADQVFRVLLIKQMNGFSYSELAFHLADSRCYRNFCGFGIGDKTPPKSVLQRDLKRVRPETMEKANRIIVKLAEEKDIERGRKVRTDCTVTESNIHAPTDSTLLVDGVRVLDRLVLSAREIVANILFSNHHKRAKRRAMEILNAKSQAKKEKPYRDLLKIAQKTVGYAERAVDNLRAFKGDPNKMLFALGIAQELEHYIPLVKQVISQTDRRVLKGETLPPSEKIVSIFEPHTDIIVKDRRETYFGHKIALTGGVSGLITDLLIKDMGVKDVSFSKGRGLEILDMVKSSWVYQRLRDFRAGIEGMISYLKRCFGLRRCNWSGFESFKAYAWSSVVTANLLLLARRTLA